VRLAKAGRDRSEIAVEDVVDVVEVAAGRLV
jgi:hypothetical protein